MIIKMFPVPASWHWQDKRLNSEMHEEPLRIIEKSQTSQSGSLPKC